MEMSVGIIGKNSFKIGVFATFLSLCILPKCWTYSITSSLGPSFEYESFSSRARTSTRQPLLGSLLPGPTASPPMLSATGQRSSDGNQGYSHFIYSRQSDSSTNLMRHYMRRQDHSHYTPAQLQIASRIQFESHLIDISTPKPFTGYRSFSTSYRNPNYYGKKTKNNENRSNVKRHFPNMNDNEEADQPRVPIPQNKNISVIKPPVNSPRYNSGSISFLPHPHSIVVTTPESRTAPATPMSPSATERPSSTQQIQNDGSYQSAVLDGSASTHHYQYQNNGGQRLSDSDENKRAAQILPPVHSSSSRRTSAGHYTASDVTLTTVATAASYNNSEHVRHSEEPIFFPATLKPTQRTYKIPGLEETDLSGLKNILQEGEKSEQTKKEFTNRRGSALPSKDGFGMALDGVKDLDCAKSLGYCEKDTINNNYPKELLNSVLTNSISSDLFKKVFGDVVDGSSFKGKDTTEEVVLAGRNNINVLTQETQLCVSQEVTIYPRVARNKDDKWMFVVNHDDYVQGVKVEKCMHEGGPCPFSEGNPLGYESVCRQKYILRKLVALNDDGKTALDTFKLPSCCVCYIKSNYVSDRIGAVSSAARNPALSDNGANNPDSVKGSQADTEEVNDSPASPVDCVDKTPTVPEKSSNSSTPLSQLPVPAFNSTATVNATLS